MKNISIFKISSFIYYNESLSMKSFQIFKIHQHFVKESEKETQNTTVNEKRKIGKFVLCSITDIFIKSFKMTINHTFYFGSSSQSKFCFLKPG